MKQDKSKFSRVSNSATLQKLFDDGDVKRWTSQRQEIVQSLPDKPFVAPRVVKALLRLSEGTFVALIAMLNLARYPGIEYLDALTATVIAFASIAFPSLLQVAGGYRLTSLLSPLPRLASVTAAWVMMFGCIVLFAFVGKVGSELSRNWLLSWAVSGLFFSIALRFVFAHITRRLNRNGQLNRRAVLVGGGMPADHVIATLRASRDTGLTVLGVFDDRGEDRAPMSSDGIRKLGTIEDLIDFVRSTRVDTLILTLPVTAENRLLQILERLWVLPVDIRLSAQDQRMRFRPRAYSYIGNLALLDLFDRPLGDWGPFLKAVEDKIIAALAIILLCARIC